MGDETEKVGQDEIEKLLAQARSGKPAAANPAAAAPSSAAAEEADKMLGQGEIEALLKQKAVTSAPKPAARPAAAPPVPELAAPTGDLEFLLDQATAALASVEKPQSDLPSGIRAFRLEEFGGTPASTEMATLDLIRDVELDLTIELGRTHMYLEEVLRLRKGSVVPLDKLAGDPVDIYVNGRLVARGEVLVLNDNFCVRVAELISGEVAAAG